MYNYGRLKKSFRRDGVKQDMIDFPTVNLGSGSWDKVLVDARQRYYRSATGWTNKKGGTKGWYVHQKGDLRTPYYDTLYGWLDQYIIHVAKTCDDDFLRLPRVEFRSEIQAKKNINRSFFTKQTLIEGLNKYKPLIDKPLIPLNSKVKEIVKKLFREYDKVIKKLMNLDDEAQTELLLTGLPAHKNIGYPKFRPQNKDTFQEEFEKVVSKIYGKKFPFTVKGLVDFIDHGLNYLKIRHVYTLFYRTKNEDESRAVYGGSVIMKAIGCLFAILRKDDGFDIPRVGDLPFVSWIDWSELFPSLASLLEQDYECIGEDIVNFDGHAKPSELDWIYEFSGITSKFVKFVNEGMKTSLVYFGPWVIKDIYFVSGNPFTQLLGTIIHMLLSYAYAEEYGVEIKHGVWQSDDNLVYYGSADLKDIEECFDKYGYPISVDKSHQFSVDKVVQYLKVYIGAIFKNDEMSYIGNLVSRYVNMLHRERGSPEIFYKFPTEDNVSMLISQLASYSSNAGSIVMPMIEILRSTEVGAEAYEILLKMKMGSITYEEVRPDLVLGFRPDWLVEII
jgi:hypothetical protein